MTWRDAVLASLNAFCDARSTRVVNRQELIAEQLASICAATGTQGQTPEYTLSKILQQLRDEGLIKFLATGQYLLLDQPIDVENEELTDEALDLALRANRLRIGVVPTDNVPAQLRRRKGQSRIRQLVTASYSVRCAVCDVGDNRLLVASHIVGWAEDPEHRGDLTNVLCLCRFHDALFETHHWSLGDDLRLLKVADPPSHTVRVLLEGMAEFRAPADFPPGAQFLQKHRMKCGFA